MSALPAKTGRLAWLDLARGVALVAMAVYHFVWDLELFGYIAPGTAGTGYWRLFARSIAGSFLIIVGISLAIAYAQGINTRRYLRRTAGIALAAIAITIATWFAMPAGLIYFGILHHIAVASVLGLVCVRWPSLVLAALAVALVVIGQTVNLPAFNPRWLAWTGLFQTPPPSNDFVPLIPWFAAVLAGIIAGRLILRFAARRDEAERARTGPLHWLGRHSLAFYLIHQPVLIALVYLATLVAPPPPQTVRMDPAMITACEAQCAPISGEAFCAAYCQCAFEAASSSVILTDPDAPQTAIDLAMSDIATQCEAETLEQLQ